MNFSSQSMIQMVALAFLTFVITLAHAASNPSTDTIYTVQLGLFDNVTIADFDELRNAGYIYSEPLATEGRQAVFISSFKSKSKAENVLYFAKGKGYEDAFVSERPLIKGQKAFVVQIASRKSKDYIDWSHYENLGQLYTILEEKDVKITSVPFKNRDKANEKALIMKAMGFADAFVKPTNTLMLHKVNQFNTIKDIDFEPRAVSADKKMNEEGLTDVPEDAVVLNIPTDYDNPITPEFREKGPTEINKEKRQSVKSLQSFLKAQNAYSSTVDGIYGKGTAAGSSMLEDNNPQYLRYKVLANETARDVKEEELTELDGLIMSVPSGSKETYAELAKHNSPIAKAYRAYILFIADKEANQAQINELMNKAIQESYASYKGDAPFDHQATYAYADLEQLILHTRYVQAALKDEPITPCWLFTKHKAEAYSAFAKAEAKGIRNYKMQNCSGFLQWDNIILLKTIASDLNPTEGDLSDEMKKKERDNDAKRNKLYLIPRALNKNNEIAIVKWNDQLWASMDLKMSEDKFFAKFGVPFKLAYHKSWIQLEDYYMEKGFKKYQANALALAVLKSIVGTDVETYMKK